MQNSGWHCQLDRSGFCSRMISQGPADCIRLRWYAERFDWVEVNSTLYGVPGPAGLLIDKSWDYAKY